MTYATFPADFQLFAHDRVTRTGTVEVAGAVAAGSGVGRVRAVLSAGGEVVAEASAELEYGGADASFDLRLAIPSRRVNHDLEVYLDDATEPDRRARYLVAGEVYVVNGQSNAVGGFTMAAADRDSFLRGYRINQVVWDVLALSDPGEWAGRAARVLTERHEVPVAVFNYAVGAQPLSFFAPGGDNFEEMTEGLRGAGVLGGVHHVFWFQGEANGWQSSVDEYEFGLRALLGDYREALGAGDCYVYQTRTYSCSHPRPYVMEAQRRLGERDGDVVTIATTAAVHDSCHFPYEGGYRVLGNRLADLVSERSFGVELGAVYSPRPVRARVTGTYEITVEVDADGAGLTSVGAPWPEFRAEGADAYATGGRIEGDAVVLTFDTDVVGATGVSHLSHAGPAPDFVQTTGGHGLLTFYDFPVTGGEDFPPGPRPDAELTWRSDAEAVGVAEAFSATLTLVNRGARPLRDVGVAIPLPAPQLIYQGGAEGVPSRGEFDPARDLWTVPELPPGDSAQLALGYFVREEAGAYQLWAQVVAAEGTDLDSRPDNGAYGTVGEDDEARLVVGRREQDCHLSVDVAASACATGAAWTLELTATDAVAPAGGLTVAVGGGTARAWAAGEPRVLRFDADSLAAGDVRRVRLGVARADDPTCANAFEVFVPAACVASAAGASPASGLELRAWPMPVAPGGVLRLGQLDGLTGAVRLVDAWGREAARLRVGGGELALPADLPAGLYVLVVDGRRARVLVR